jgi:hemerythrin-like metal-binding protein
MGKIEWTKEIATGIKEIDEQHKKFISACANIAAGAEKSAEPVRISAAIKKLEGIALEHFSTEGSLMAGSFYPDKKGHYKLHGFFLEELKKVKSRAEAGETGPEFAVEIKDRLADWFILHIKKNDIKMASYIISK